jgi:hypothetical protein
MTTAATTPETVLAQLSELRNRKNPSSRDQAEFLLEYFEALDMACDGLEGYMNRRLLAKAGRYASPALILAAYREEYEEEFGEGKHADDACLAILLSFHDLLSESGTIGGQLMIYCEGLLNGDEKRPELTMEHFLVDRSTPRKKGVRPLKGQQDFPFSEGPAKADSTPPAPASEPPPAAEPEKPRKFRAPGRKKDWTGQRITYKANDQKIVIGRVTADAADRIWFTDEHGKAWGGEEGVDKARCKAVPLEEAGEPRASREADVVIGLSKGQSKALRAAMAATAPLPDRKPGETLFIVEERVDGRYSVRLRLINSHSHEQRPFMSFVLVDNKTPPGAFVSTTQAIYDPGAVCTFAHGGRELTVRLELAGEV